jgi:hypothetical protein
MTRWIAARFARRFAFSLCAVLLLAAAPLDLSFAQAQQRPFTPTDESPEDLPAGNGREETFYACTACHGFKIVAQQGLTRGGWDDHQARHERNRR